MTKLEEAAKAGWEQEVTVPCKWDDLSQVQRQVRIDQLRFPLRYLAEDPGDDALEPICKVIRQFAAALTAIVEEK